jgi:diaminopimelate decarboxylase
MFDSQIIQKFQEYSTPFYYYDLNLLEKNINVLKEASSKFGFKIHYAMKANADERILQSISGFGLGADCVSGNEVSKALQIGFPKNEVVFAGVGKTDSEIVAALENEIQCINCESIQELEVVDSLAQKIGKTASIAIRINPDLDARTHRYITTGLDENKFGIHQRDLMKAMEHIDALKNLKFFGLHFHIGSQITDLDVFKKLCNRVNEIQDMIEKQGIHSSNLNLGGGLGVDYYNPDENLTSDYHSYFELFQNFLKLQPDQTVHFELGRSLVAQCGTLIGRVLYVKQGITTRFAVLDAGMTELIRPALYQAYHKIENLTNAGNTQKYEVVGPVCETSDCFGKAVELPEVRRGDLIAIRTAGAYGEVMASRYNMRDPAKVIYSDSICKK